MVLDLPSQGNASHGQASSSETPAPVGRPFPQYEPESDNNYSLTGEKIGICTIFNHRTFNKQLERKGTEKDVEVLETLFKSIGYEVDVHNDLKSNDILRILNSLRNRDYSDCNVFVICVLSHGDGELIWAKDQMYMTSQLYDSFTERLCPSLAGKPKLFFIQACKGSSIDNGVGSLCYESENDKIPENYDGKCLELGQLEAVENIAPSDIGQSPFIRYFNSVPTEPDFLVVHSAVPGYFSHRGKRRGSWFIQCLVKALWENVHSKDLMSILTIANKCLAIEFPKKVSNRRDKQVACIASTLTKLLFLPQPISTDTNVLMAGLSIQ